MNDFLFSVNAVVPLFFLCALGWCLTKFKVWDSEFLKTANGFSFNILIPSMLFYNIYISDFSSLFDAKLFAFILILVAVVCILGFIVVPMISKVKARQAVIIQALFRGNFALLGIPLAQSLAGDEGAQIASVFLAFLIPVFNVLATVILCLYSDEKPESSKEIIIKILKNPLIIGCMAGLLFSFARIPLPQIILKPIKSLQSIATPFALLVLGGDFKFTSFIKNFRCVVSTGITRLLLIPSVAIFLAALLGFRGIHIALIISVFATPVAVASTAMTYKMKGDYDLACQVVVFTTVCSVFSLTLLTFISRSFGIL